MYTGNIINELIAAVEMVEENYFPEPVLEIIDECFVLMTYEAANAAQNLLGVA